MNKKNVVPFKIDTGISDRLIRRLLKKGKEYGINGIYPFSTEKLVTAHWVHLKCKYGCNQYNTNWTCPPATPGPDITDKILKEYSLALLLRGIKKNGMDFYRNNSRKRTKQVQCWKGTVVLERLLFLMGYYKAFSLVGECCALCRECAYPENCKFPQERRPSVESFSIDVIGTLANLGMSAGVAEEQSDDYKYFAIILLE